MLDRFHCPVIQWKGTKGESHDSLGPWLLGGTADALVLGTSTLGCIGSNPIGATTGLSNGCKRYGILR
jgi:hypothetical protein